MTTHDILKVLRYAISEGNSTKAIGLVTELSRHLGYEDAFRKGYRAGVREVRREQEKKVRALTTLESLKQLQDEMRGQNDKEAI
jgi:hypothetical protein